jgi:hypothetical protein
MSKGKKQVTCDVLLIGGGPATLGFLQNAAKNHRLHELVTTGEGIAIVEQGLSLGGGDLQHFGLNSNTSANGFMRGLYSRKNPGKGIGTSPVKGE